MSLRVLLADESGSIRKVFQMGLQDYGADVKSVHNGLDVVEVAQNYKPDIIFADILLQKKNGYEVSSELKEHQELSMTPVVLMWSSFMELDQGKYKSCGAKGELEKPFDVDKMRELIKNLVETTRSQQLSDFLSFPKSITADFVEEEKRRQENGGVYEPSSTDTEPLPPPVNVDNSPASFDAPETGEQDLSLEDDEATPAQAVEETSEFNLKAEGEEFNMYEVPPAAPVPEAPQPESEDENWEAKPLNDMTMSQDEDTDQDLDQFQAVNIEAQQPPVPTPPPVQTAEKPKLDDFLYKPEPPPNPQTITASGHSPLETVGTGEIQNVNVPNYEYKPGTGSESAMGNEEMEAVIRQEVRMALKKMMKEELPPVLEKIVREELEKIFQQEMSLKGAEQSPS